MRHSSLPYFSIALLLVFTTFLTVIWFDAVAHLTDIILNVDTYSHGQVIPFVSIWLVWSRRDQLKLDDIYIWWPGLLPLIAALALGYLGQIFDVKLAEHIAYISAIQGLLLLFLGPNFYQRILFPSLFLYLVIPVGHDLVPVMQDVTAHMSVSILGVLGIPYELDGILITMNSGIYEVAQACAGVRFLFTSIVTGALLAHLAYRSLRKRVIMVIVAAAVSIFANVARVVGILLISEATDQSFAREVDHIIYGWVFLSIILLLIISIAYKFAEDETELDTEPFIAFKPYSPKVGIALTPALAFFAVWGTYLAQPQAPKAAYTVLPPKAAECEECGIRKLKNDNSFKGIPFEGSDAELHARYRVAADMVTISSALYCPQRPGSKLLAAGSSGGLGWQAKAGTRSQLAVNGIPFIEEIYMRREAEKLVWTSYYIDGRWLSSNRDVRLASAYERFSKGVTAGAVFVVSSNIYSSEEDSRAAMDKFLSNLSPDQFLWDELKQSKEGVSVCAE